MAGPGLEQAPEDVPIAQNTDTTEAGVTDRPDARLGANQMVWVVIVLLIVALIVGDLIASSVEQPTPISVATPGMRAVIVPTGDASRTVVVAPCGTGTSLATTSLPKLLSSAGTVVVQLPQGQGNRIVMVPMCSGNEGGAATQSFFPAAAFVATAGTPVPPVGTANSSSLSVSIGVPQSAQYQVSVPPGSPIRTVVLSPCQRASSSTPAAQLLGPSGSSTTAVAPGC